MKSLSEIISEKLRINKDTKAKHEIEIEIPKYDAGDCSYDGTIWKTITFPLDRYYIYIDKYHSDCLHFNVMDDFLSQLVMFQDDYEDFNFDKDVLYTSDDLQDAFWWYVNKLGLNLNKFKNSSGEWDTYELNKYLNETINNSKKMKFKTYDSAGFFEGVATGEWNDETFDDCGFGAGRATESDYENFPEFIKKYL